MAEREPRREIRKLLGKHARSGVALLAILAFDGWLADWALSAGSSAPVTITTKAPKPRHVTYGAVPTERVTTLVDSYTKKIIGLEASVPSVNILDTKACGRKPRKTKHSVNTTKPNYNLVDNILSKNRRDQYYFNVEKQNGAVDYLEIDQGMKEDCVGMDPAEQDINFSRYGNDWVMEVGYTATYGGAETYKDYETEPSAGVVARPLTPGIFTKYSHAMHTVVDNAIAHRNLPEDSLKRYPS